MKAMQSLKPPNLETFPKIYLGSIWYRKSLFIKFGKGNHILAGSHFRILNFPYFNGNHNFLWVTIALLIHFSVLLMILITFRPILMLFESFG